MNVLVLGAGGPAANNFIRSINDEHYVIGADIDPLMIHRSEAPAVIPLVAEDRLAEIQAHVQANEIDVIWAQPTPEVAWLAAHREEVGAAVYLPPLEIIEKCNDKLETAVTLSTMAPASAELDRLDEYLTRHDRLWMRMRSGAGSAGAITVSDRDFAYAWADHWYDLTGTGYGDWMISPILPGRDLSWTGLYQSGRLVISSAKERLRGLGASRSPAQVASTATAQEIVIRPDVNATCETAVEIIAGQEAHGVFMVDLREDADGVPKITEINCGRFGTTCDMYQWAGPNLPELVIDLATGDYHDGYERRDEHVPGALWLRNIDQAGRMVIPGASQILHTDQQKESL